MWNTVMRSCSDIPDANFTDCSKPWGLNCVEPAGFEPHRLWNITSNIWTRCPTDPRLWHSGSGASTLSSASLGDAGCQSITGAKLDPYLKATKYANEDVYGRLSTWKFPLFQLVASSPRPPLGLDVEAFVVFHLLGDPIGHIRDLIKKLSRCQEHADYWHESFAALAGLFPERDEQLSREAKAFAMITISYDEWGEGEYARELLQSSLNTYARRRRRTPTHREQFATFLRLCNQTADALAADRATKFLPILIAQTLFMCSIALALVKTVADDGTTLLINVEVHSIAFSALYFWILPAVFLSSIIGTSQTQNSMPSILHSFRVVLTAQLPPRQVKLPEWETLGDVGHRVANGGVYSWVPVAPNPFGTATNPTVELWQRILTALRSCSLPLLIVSAGTFTGFTLSWYVPPKGWEPRHCAQASIYFTWVISFLMTSLFKFLPSSKGNKSWSFRVTFAKDFLIGWGVIAGVIVTQIGVFNRCISYTRWGRVGLWLPMQPDAQTYLKQSLHSSYIIITCVGLGVVMFGPPIYIFWEYKAGLLVLMQRDDGEATFRIPNPRTWFHQSRSTPTSNDPLAPRNLEARTYN